MVSIYFVGTYKPIMCGIADYTSFITRKSPVGRWGVLSFDVDKYGSPLTHSDDAETEPVWYGIPGRHEFSASVILQGFEELGAKNEDAVLWFQHEFGIWPDSRKFVAMLKGLDIPKIVTIHTLHCQSSETSSGLCKSQYDLLQALLPHVEAITVFSQGVCRTATSVSPKYSTKVYLMKHGIHTYPEVSGLSRKQAKEKLNDWLLYESDLDQPTKEGLHKERIFLDPDAVVVGQTGFLRPNKQSGFLYYVRDNLQKNIPRRRIVAVRLGHLSDNSHTSYVEQLRRQQNRRDKFLLETWLPHNMLPIAQRAFDINFYWPRECTGSGILAHALGCGAVVAGRDMEGVGETLKEAGQLVGKDLRQLLMKTENLILNAELRERMEEKALRYAAKFSWENQARRHYELAESILHTMPL